MGWRIENELLHWKAQFDIILQDMWVTKCQTLWQWTFNIKQAEFDYKPKSIIKNFSFPIDPNESMKFWEILKILWTFGYFKIVREILRVLRNSVFFDEEDNWLRLNKEASWENRFEKTQFSDAPFQTVPVVIMKHMYWNSSINTIILFHT